MKKKNCMVCKQEFIPKRYNSDFCEDCRRNRFKEVKKIYDTRYESKEKSKILRKKWKDNNKGYFKEWGKEHRDKQKMYNKKNYISLRDKGYFKEYENKPINKERRKLRAKIRTLEKRGLIQKVFCSISSQRLQ